jgi:chromosome segregation ATPase
MSSLEDANARVKTLYYEQDRLLKQLDKHDREMGRMEQEVQAARNATTHAERRQGEEEVKVKTLREDAARGRKALDNLKTAATVSLC